MFRIFKKEDLSLYTDEQLMKAIKQGKQAAFALLYDRYHRKLFRYLMRLLQQDRGLAEDFLQDLFMKVMESAAQYDDTQKVSTWLYTIATNKCRSHWRLTSNRSKLMEDFEPWENFSNQHAGELLDGKILNHQINTLLNQMNASDKEIILLRFHQELTIKEIAAIMQLPEGTVKSRIFYLLRKLSVKLKMYQQI